jgi:hypothetical protein
MKKNLFLKFCLLTVIMMFIGKENTFSQRGFRGSFGRGGVYVGGRLGHYENSHIGVGIGYTNRILPYGRLYRLPSKYIRLKYNGYPYFFAEGLFYTSYGDYYGLVAPPFGLTISFLPRGYMGLSIGGYPYYYYSGIFYRPTEDEKYQVVQAPIGAELPSIPKEAKVIVINDQKLYEYLGTYYKEIVGADGKTKYIVQGKDGVLNTESQIKEVTVESSGTNYAPSIGDVVMQLPSRYKTVVINNKKLYVTPENIYYEEFIEDNHLKFRVVGM